MSASYTAPVTDTIFVLKHIVGLPELEGHPGFEDASMDTVRTILNEAGKFASEVLLPTNQPGDRQGCTRHEDGRVTTPDGYREAYEAFCEAGWGTLMAPAEYGGQNLPHVIGSAIDEYMSSANMAFSMYPGLTQGAISAILVTGSDEQKRQWLPKMVQGQWSGTMNLTEPQCGTDLGLIRTSAEPAADGSWRVTGSKMFISAGEHDLTENIIHLVLARTPDAPKGVKGLSLFIVPKFLVDADGAIGARNGASCGSIEEKMGIHGNATCVMNYDGTTGYLLGEQHQGLKAMFIMMNVARLGVGAQGLSQSEIATQNAVAYARERLQGRALSGPKNPDGPADSILVHPDVRRMLLDARAFNEGARALFLWAALQADLSRHATDEKIREQADDLLSLLTPVIKAYLTDQGFQNTVNAQQVFGGHGYIAEWGMEQFVRDARISQIYEGTNGVQALDLVGRKLAQNGGRSLMTLQALVRETIRCGKEQAETAELAAQLEGAVQQLEQATMWLMQNAFGKPDNAAAGSVPYLRLMAIVVLGHFWLRLAMAAQADQSGEFSTEFLNAKILTAKHYFEREIPKAGAEAAQVMAGADTLMAFPDDAF